MFILLYKRVISRNLIIRVVNIRVIGIIFKPIYYANSVRSKL